MPKTDRPVALSGHTCQGCGSQLEPYEVMACRIRGVQKPVCIGCLVNALVALRDQIYPLLEAALLEVDHLAEKAAAGG